MPDLAFTAEAMAACAKTTHQWRWVPTWGRGIGFRECWRCGETGPIGKVEVVGLGAQPAEALPTAAPPPEPEPPRAPLKPGPGQSAESLARDTDIVRLRGEGVSVLELARQFGVSDARIYQILRRAAGPVNHRANPGGAGAPSTPTGD